MKQRPEEEIEYRSCVGTDSISVTARKGLMPVGCVDLSRVNNNTFYFNRLFIRENFRGMGYSHKLMKTAFAIIDDKQCNTILEINPYGGLGMNKLIKFYKRYGFVQLNNKSFMRKYKRQRMKEEYYIPPKIRVKNWELITSNDFYNQYNNRKSDCGLVIEFKKHIKLRDGFYDKWCITLLHGDKDGYLVTRKKYFDFKINAKKYARNWMKRHILK